MQLVWAPPPAPNPGGRASLLPASAPRPPILGESLPLAWLGPPTPNPGGEPPSCLVRPPNPQSWGRLSVHWLRWLQSLLCSINRQNVDLNRPHRNTASSPRIGGWGAERTNSSTPPGLGVGGPSAQTPQLPQDWGLGGRAHKLHNSPRSGGPGGRKHRLLNSLPALLPVSADNRRAAVSYGRR